MQRKISIILIIIGVVISCGALLFAQGQQRVITTTLGLIIACGGCLMLMTAFKNAEQHRPFIIIISILFAFLIIGFIIKAIIN